MAASKFDSAKDDQLFMNTAFVVVDPVDVEAVVTEGLVARGTISPEYIPDTYCPVDLSQGAQDA